MKTDTPPPSVLRRLLACCGFAACWLGAAVTGYQATVGEAPARVSQIEQRREARPDSTGDAAQPSRAALPGSSAFPARTLAELWR